jgi:hypothetical protein
LRKASGANKNLHCKQIIAPNAMLHSIDFGHVGIAVVNP